MPNHLSGSISPYLLQHAENPVNWFPWGQQAFDEAVRRDVPIFLSVGYSACHWCHVMAHESFENEDVAHFLNEHFVNIKVDREELPAVDALYMQATQAMTGHGGWPMSVWLDHARRPWYAGTYFPPVPSRGQPSFMQLLVALHNAWQSDREHITSTAKRVTQALYGETSGPEFSALSAESIGLLLDDAIDVIGENFDFINGGFGSAPKFPAPLVIEFLLRHSALKVLSGESLSDHKGFHMAERSLKAMAGSGLFDHISGGFARYCVDDTWTVPHFEKMLYDNAQLLSVYTTYFRLRQDEWALRVIEMTASFLIDELTTPQGAFASSLDADSHSDDVDADIEGAYYVWTRSQLEKIMDAQDVDYACDILGVTEQGNFEEGSTVLTMRNPPLDSERWDRIRTTMNNARTQRSRPARDDKVVAAWNGLAISALATAGALLERAEWVEAAVRAADLLVTVHLGADATTPMRVCRVSRDGKPQINAEGVLEDQAEVANAFMVLTQVTGDMSWLELAHCVLRDIQKHFTHAGGVSDVSDDSDSVIADHVHRPVDKSDSVTRSGWVGTANAALTYAALTQDSGMREWAERLLAGVTDSAKEHPRFSGAALSTLVAWLDGPREVAVLGGPDSHLSRIVVWANAPGLVYATKGDAPLLHNRSRQGEADTAFVCRHFVCAAPTTDGVALAQAIATTRR